MTRLITLVLAVISLATPCFGATYYIDITAGADTNNGTTKATPWKHVPGMPTCTNTCAATTPAAGDSFILKGGETWGTTNFPIRWQWEGTVGSRIVIGVDATWYTGGSWSRPIWDGEDTPSTDTYNSTTNTALWYCDWLSVQCDYVTVTNIEMKRFAWTGAPAFAYCSLVNLYGATNVLLDQLYLHDWSHSGATVDCPTVGGMTASPYGAGNVLQYSIVDGSREADSGGVVWSIATVQFNEISYVGQGVNFTGASTILNNTIHHCIHSFVALDHPNVVQSLGGPASAYNTYIGNNLFYGGTGADNGCESLYVGNPNEDAYIWNNVMVDMAGNPMTITGDTGTQVGERIFIWNNTFYFNKDGQSNYYCLNEGRGLPEPYIEIDARNNHCITSQTRFDNPSPALNATTLTISDNLMQAIATANGQGYATGQTYRYSPTDSGDATVGTGVDLTAKCSGVLASLCSDTTYGAQRVGNVIAGAGRVANARPSGSAWDIGAFQYAPVSLNLSGSLSFSGGVVLQ